MPAGSDPTPDGHLVELPHTWRPLGTRMVGLVGGIGLMAVCVASWVAIGPGLRAQFHLVDRAAMLILLAIAATVWWALVRPRVSATDGGVVVVNGYRRRELDWAQIVAVRMRRGAPWAEMDLADGTSIPVMAFQGSDGDRARDGLRALGTLVRAHSQVDRDD